MPGPEDKPSSSQPQSDAKKDPKKSDAPVAAEESIERSAYNMDLVVVHPLVLLSVVDHYTRVAKDTNKRVVGVLLGELYKGKADITNSYAVPFEEDPRDPTVWYIDRQYHEEMFAMFKKVSAGEKILGWYSTGPKIRPADLEINEMFRAYTADPILVIVDVNPKVRHAGEQRHVCALCRKESNFLTQHSRFSIFARFVFLLVPYRVSWRFQPRLMFPLSLVLRSPV